MGETNSLAETKNVKSLFSEFFIEDEEINKKIWTEGIIIFDSNALLNLYEFSSDIANNYLKAMETCKDRIWLPSWVVYEFLVKRETIIENQIKSYDEFNETILKAIEPLKSNKKHPYVTKEEQEYIVKEINSIVDVVKKNKEEYQQSCSCKNDSKLERLLSIISSNVGPPLKNEELEDIHSIAEKRMIEEIPPGYKDYQSKKKLHQCPNLLQKSFLYGDYIIWKQVVDYASENNKDVVFITNDIKRDWYDERKRARRELVKEFYESTNGCALRIYPSSEFFEYASKRKTGKEMLDKKTLNELKTYESNLRIEQELLKKNYEEFSNANKYLNLHLERIFSSHQFPSFDQSIEALMDEREVIVNRMKDADMLIHEINNTSHEIFDSKIKEFSNLEKLAFLQKEELELQRLRANVDEEIKHLAILAASARDEAKQKILGSLIKP